MTQLTNPNDQEIKIAACVMIDNLKTLKTRNQALQDLKSLGMASSIPEEANSPNTNFRNTTAQKLYQSRRVRSFDLYSGQKQNQKKQIFSC